MEAAPGYPYAMGYTNTFCRSEGLVGPGRLTRGSPLALGRLPAIHFPDSEPDNTRRGHHAPQPWRVTRNRPGKPWMRQKPNRQLACAFHPGRPRIIKPDHHQHSATVAPLLYDHESLDYPSGHHKNPDSPARRRVATPRLAHAGKNGRQSKSPARWRGFRGGRLEAGKAPDQRLEN